MLFREEPERGCSLEGRSESGERSRFRQLQKEALFQQFITKTLFLFPKMNVPELLRAHMIIQDSVSELLASQIKSTAVGIVKAVAVAVFHRNAQYNAAEKILYQESGYGTLPKGWIIRAPIRTKPRRAGFSAPGFLQQIIIIPGGPSGLIADVGCFPSPKSVQGFA